MTEVKEKEEDSDGVSGMDTSRHRDHRRGGGCGSHTRLKRGSEGIMSLALVNPGFSIAAESPVTGLLTSSLGDQAMHFTS